MFSGLLVTTQETCYTNWDTFGQSDTPYLSVALKASKKDLELNFRNSDKEIDALKAKHLNLKEYKDQQQEEKRKANKLEKKMRQKQKKKVSKIDNEVVNATEKDNHVETIDNTEEKRRKNCMIVCLMIWCDLREENEITLLVIQDFNS